MSLHFLLLQGSGKAIRVNSNGESCHACQGAIVFHALWSPLH